MHRARNFRRAHFAGVVSAIALCSGAAFAEPEPEPQPEPARDRARDADERDVRADAVAAPATRSPNAAAPNASAPSSATTVALPPPMALTSRLDQSSSGGLSPMWFFVGVGATALAATAVVVSGLDASNKHDDFIALGCAPGATGPKDATCNRRSDEGATASFRTNLLLGATAFLALSTTMFGVVFVRWSSQPSGGVATIGGKF